jgi:hypothetical protein
MELSNSFEKSLQILRKIQSVDKIEDRNLWIPTPWINGREEGFCLFNYKSKHRIIFSECRNSDLCVIYFCNENGFIEDKNMITEETYRKAKYTSFEKALNTILPLFKIENWI